MNFNLPFIPQRPEKPREKGVTMVMDKGLSLRQAEDFIESSGNLTDIVKLGFGTAIVTNKLSEKIKLYQAAGIEVYFGGTLFEAFIARNMFEDYRKLIDQYDLNMVEVSDGSIEIDHEEKCNYIKTLTSQVTVLSEVGYKDSEKIIPPYKWIELMQKEIDAGSWKVIAEARE